MAKLSHTVEYGFALIGTWVAQALPPWLADRIGALLGDMAHIFLASRRRIAFDNLQRGMGDTLSEAQMRDIVRNVFRNTGRTLMEFARMGKTVRSGAKELFVSNGVEYLKRAHDEGRGGIILTAHFGSFELFGAWLSTLDIPVDLLTGVQHNKKVNDLLNSFRRELGVGLIPIDKGIRGVFKALKANRFVGLISDQHAPSGVVIDFFGRKAATPKGPAAFAVKAGSPILPFVMRRERYDRHVVMAGEPIYPPESGDVEKDVRTMTEAYTRYFESCIRQYPDQWLWTHRRWKV